MLQSKPKANPKLEIRMKKKGKRKAKTYISVQYME